MLHAPSQSHHSFDMVSLKKSFGLTSPSLAKKIRRMVSGDGYLLPSNIRQIVALDKLHLRANLAWLIFFAFRYSDNVMLFIFSQPSNRTFPDSVLKAQLFLSGSDHVLMRVIPPVSQVFQPIGLRLINVA